MHSLDNLTTVQRSRIALEHRPTGKRDHPHNTLRTGLDPVEQATESLERALSWNPDTIQGETLRERISLATAEATALLAGQSEFGATRYMKARVASARDALIRAMQVKRALAA